MNNIELLRLAECEQVIERGMKTFTEVGAALMEIRESKLYRQTFATFEDYCRDRWGMKERRAYQLMDAAEVSKNLESCTIVQLLPATESQARPLAKLEPEQQRQVWQQVTEMPGVITAAKVQAVVDEYRAVTRPENIHVSDDSYEWYTPTEYIEAARQVMGSIDLDPASSKNAQVIVKAGTYYTKEQDGLSLDWFGNVWVNPPYCMPDIENFVDKIISEYAHGKIGGAIFLTNNCTDAGWFHKILAASGLVCLTKGRVKFWGPHTSQGGARQGQTIFYLGRDKNKFTEVFSDFGIVVRLA